MKFGIILSWNVRYARVVDHLAVRKVAQGAPLGGGSTLHLQQSSVKGEIGTETLRHLALETMNTRYPQDKWLHIFTDGSQNRRIHKRWRWHSLWTFLLLYVTGTTFDCLWWRNWSHTHCTTITEPTPKQIWESCYLFWLKGCNTICGINRNCDTNRDQRLPGPNMTN